MLLFFRLAALSAALLAATLHAQTEKHLVIGVAGDAPFVIKNSQETKFDGISIDIWEEIAKAQKLNFKYQYFDNVDKALAALENQRLDAVVGPISITAKRAERLRFSQPYYQSSLSIASRNDELSLWAKIRPFFSLQLLAAIGLFLSILAAVGLLFWLAEHKKSPEQFPKDPKKGIANGMWLALVTMSTTGYGDMAPITLKGRIIAGCWMVISLIFATSMIAGISSTLTLSSFKQATINQVEQFPGKKIAAVENSPALSFIKEHQGKKVSVASLNEAMEKLQNKKIDAVVFDRPQLLFYKNQHKAENIHIPKAEYYKQGYGFAFQTQSPLANPVNLALLKLAEIQRSTAIIEAYLGKQQ